MNATVKVLSVTIVVTITSMTGRAQSQESGTTPSSMAQWEHLRVIGERLGVPRTLAIGAEPTHSIAINDFDGDGNADIAVGSTDAQDVSVLLGDAWQPFASAVRVRRSDWPTVDADVDVGGTRYHAHSGPLASVTTVSNRSGKAAMRRAAALAVAVVADFDGDGRVDVEPAPAGSIALASGDLDDDDATDLVAAAPHSSSIQVLFGDGSGGFSRRATIDVGMHVAPHGLVVGNIDSDRVVDLVVLAEDGAAVAILRGDGSGGFIPLTRVALDTQLSSSDQEAVIASTEADAYQGVLSLTLNPSTIAGGSGATSTGTITLNAPAPAGGVNVTLTSSNVELAASVPAVTVPAGATTATFTLGTNKNYRRYSGLAFTVTVSAAHGTTTRSATLNVTAQPRPGPLSSFDAHNEGPMCFGVGVRQTSSGTTLEFGSAGNLFTCVPPSNPVGQDGTCSFRQECALGCEFRPPLDGFKFRDVCATTGPYPVAVNPKLVVGGNPSLATLRLNTAAPVNSFGTLSSATVLANTIPNFPTQIPAGATTANADVLTARVAAPQFAPIDGNYNTPRSDGSRGGRGGLTWLVLVTGTPPPFRLTSFVFDPPTLTSVVGGGTVIATARMNQVAPAPTLATATMTVSSSDPAAATPSQPNVTFTEGSSNAGFFIETHPVSADTPVTISVALGATTLTRQLTVRATPAATRVNSFFLDPFDVPGGETSTGTVVLNGAAGSGGAVVALQSNNTAVATMPASVTVPPGSDRTNFTITTSPVSSNTTVGLSASFNSTFAQTSLIVTAGSSPPPPSPPPPPQTATLTVTATGRSGERVTSSPAGINVSVGSTGSASFNTGTSITLSVSNGRDAIWSGACSSGSSKTKTCTFTIGGNATVTANVQ